ncbi:polysaccharide lyase family 7 protein [Christiangramia portivictoriae]|uniref:polysaccharide lyase family 7 protein n=1 Tax=Christiangramia portivictoriae TaxID=326069 RepID=UPI0012F98ABB|nr:polysaccharide lyase family 7 protein [Christiangramia portivictoriae]
MIFNFERYNILILYLCSMSLVSCQKDDSVADEPETPVIIGGEEPEEPVVKDYKLPEIDLSNWKVTLPVGNPSEVEPPEIFDYATNENLIPFMYNDSTDGSLVFYTYPESSTANSSYSRTELREQMEPGSNDKNWTFEEGGRMRGTLAVPDISRDAEGDFHRVIIMQIHGRLTNAQRDQIGEDDNNAPPILKIYWDDGKLRVKTKILKDLNASEEEILHTSAWGDDEGFNFSERVDTDPFTLEIIASEGKIEIILNDDEKVIYESIHMKKWNVFENYFKAGNYLVTTDENAFSKVKFYELEVTH